MRESMFNIKQSIMKARPSSKSKRLVKKNNKTISGIKIKSLTITLLTSWSSSDPSMGI